MSTDAAPTLALAEELIRRPSVSPEDHGCLQLIGQADPMGTIGLYGERVLPALRS